jgi:choline transport protein
MSEEIHNPSLVVPRSIMLSILLNGTTGFAMVMALLFCIGNMENALSTPTGYPFIEIFLQATNSVGGSAAMAAIVTSLAVCATVGILASTSRMFWSFARDHGLPFWHTLERVSSFPYHREVGLDVKSFSNILQLTSSYFMQSLLT